MGLLKEYFVLPSALDHLAALEALGFDSMENLDLGTHPKALAD
tara:strand:- start:420 stop:548 length:129 start_codon:yes stop_codon:yes gene_type:complete